MNDVSNSTRTFTYTVKSSRSRLNSSKTWVSETLVHARARVKFNRCIFGDIQCANAWLNSIDGHKVILNACMYNCIERNFHVRLHSASMTVQCSSQSYFSKHVDWLAWELIRTSTSCCVICKTSHPQTHAL